MMLRECSRDEASFTKILDLFVAIAKEARSTSASAHPQKSPGSTTPAKPPAAPKNGIHIHAVDDSIALLDIVQRILQSEGYRVTVSAEAEGALEKITKDHPDLVLLDVEMPGMDGGEFLNKLRARPKLKDIAVIFMTGLVSSEEAEQLNKKAEDPYLAKPFTREKIVAMVNEFFTKTKSKHSGSTPAKAEKH